MMKQGETYSSKTNFFLGVKSPLYTTDGVSHALKACTTIEKEVNNEVLFVHGRQVSWHCDAPCNTNRLGQSYQNDEGHDDAEQLGWA